MRKWIHAITAVSLGALCALGASSPAQAQAVYKCDWRSYSEQPCSTRVMRTYDAAAETPHSKPPEVVAHRLPGETPLELAVRRHRIALSESDRDECARLDKKIPFERQRVRSSASQDEVDEAQDSLIEARKRFNQLRC